MIELSPEQDRAAQRVEEWRRDPTAPQVFRLFGSAGTGKTSIAMYLTSGVEGEVYFGAYTGKAAYVLQQKGCPNAMTLHKLIYIPKNKSAARLRDLEEKLQNMTAAWAQDPAIPAIQRAIAEENKNLSRPAFSLNMDSPLRRCKLLVVDEVSMVDQQMGEDLESFGCKILVLGDPAQLPPVYGTGYFTEQAPDFMLREIHRQARDNPIIRLATEIREQRMPALGVYGESRVIREMDQGMALAADQMLVGKNATRAGFNKRVRQLRGFGDGMPVITDKLVCLRNSRDYPMLNGSLWRCAEVPVDVDQDRMILTVQNEEGQRVECLTHKHYFRGETPAWWERAEAEEFDFGYAMTTHKAQGSQWDNVLVYDESWVFKADRWKWLYTAVTRAAKRVDIVRVQ